MNYAHNFISNLLTAHKDVGIVLSEATNTEKTVKRALKLMTVNHTKLAYTHRKLTVGVGLAAVNHNSTGTVHRLNAVCFLINKSRVHIILIVIPVSACFPKLAVHNKGSLYLNIVISCMNFAPIINKCILKSHTLRKEEGESGTLLAKHKEVHLLTDLTVVTLFSLLHKLVICLKLLLRSESNTVDSGKHLVVLIVLPVCAGLLCDLKCLKRLCVAKVRTYAHIDIVALLIEADNSILCKIADMLNLVFFATALHKSNSLLTGKNVRLNRKVFLNYLAHFLFNVSKILISKLLIAKVYVIVEALFSCRTVSEYSLREKASYCLSHNVCRRVTKDVKLFFLVFAFSDSSVIQNYLHLCFSLYH